MGLVLFILNETVSHRVSEHYEFDNYFKHSPKYIHTLLAQYFIYRIQIKFLKSNFILISYQLNAIRIPVKVKTTKGKKKTTKELFSRMVSSFCLKALRSGTMRCIQWKWKRKQKTLVILIGFLYSITIQGRGEDLWM